MLQCNNGCALGRYVRSGCAFARMRLRAENCRAAPSSPRPPQPRPTRCGKGGLCFRLPVCADDARAALGAELRVTCAGSLDAIVRRRAAARGTAHRTPHALGRCGVSRGAMSARKRRVGDQRSAPPRGLGLRASKALGSRASGLGSRAGSHEGGAINERAGRARRSRAWCARSTCSRRAGCGCRVSTSRVRRPAVLCALQRAVGRHARR